MKRKYILSVFLFFAFHLSFCQQYGCPDPESWNYDTEVDEDSAAYCIYTQNCSEGFENRVFAISGNGIHVGSMIYLISTDLMDTLAVHEFVDLGWEGNGATFTSLFNHFDACVEIGECYFLDVHLPDSLYYLNLSFIQYASFEYPTTITLFQPLDYFTDHRRVLVGEDFEQPCGFLGCMDPSASNYNPFATFDFGCQYCDGTNGVRISSEFTFNGNTPWQIRNEEGLVASGSFSEDSPQLSDLVCLETGCYEFRIYGDDYHFNEISLYTYEDSLLTTMTLTEDSEAIFPFGIGVENCGDPNAIYGCTNPLGQNYDPLATIDDGSCDLQNDQCGITLDAYLDTIQQQLVIDPDFFATDYPIAILWDMGDGTPLFQEGLGDIFLYDTIGVYEVCATLYSWQFFEYLPLCYAKSCIEIDAFEFGFSGGFPVFLNDGTASTEDEYLVKQVQLYPNPAVDRVSVKGISGSIENISIFALDGTKVAGKVNVISSADNFTIDVSTLGSGVYLVVFESSETNFVGRLLKAE